MKMLPGTLPYSDVDNMVQKALRELSPTAQAKRVIEDDIIEVRTTKGPMIRAVAGSKTGLGKAGFHGIEYTVSTVNYALLYPTDSYWE